VVERSDTTGNDNESVMLLLDIASFVITRYALLLTYVSGGVAALNHRLISVTLPGSGSRFALLILPRRTSIILLRVLGGQPGKAFVNFLGIGEVPVFSFFIDVALAGIDEVDGRVVIVGGQAGLGDPGL
jgi:hypothetical protein